MSRPDSETTVLRLAAGLEKSSEHPLARAIVAGAGERQLEPSEIDGLSVGHRQGSHGNRGVDKIALGNAALMQDVGADLLAAGGRSSRHCAHPAAR